MPHVDDAHSRVVSAIEEVNEIRVSELNETELESVLNARAYLYESDRALAQRSSYSETPDPSKER